MAAACRLFTAKVWLVEPHDETKRDFNAEGGLRRASDLDAERLAERARRALEPAWLLRQGTDK